MRQKKRERNGIIFYIVALQMAALLFVTGKGAGQIYLDLLLLLLAMTLGLYFYARVYGGNTKVVVYTALLITIGIMLQSIFRQESILANPKLFALGNPAFDLQIQYIVAIIGMFAMAFLYRKGKFLANPTVLKGMYLGSVSLSLATLLFAKAVGTAKNWIIIGGLSIQTSEINKLLYLFLMAGTLGGVERPSKRRIQFAFLVTFSQLFFLVLQSEFGTILLILLVFPIYLFLFVPNLKVAGATVVGYVAVGGAAAGIGTFVQTMAEQSAGFAGWKLTRIFLSNYEKIANRFIYWLHPEQDPMGLGYQLLKAKEAILLGGWFGTDSVTNLPVKTSDMVFPALIERCGIIIAILVLVVIILLWLEGIKIFVVKKDKYHQAVCAGIVFMMFYQALIIVAGSCGMCPLTGITLPFISSGGTSLLISGMMMGIVVTISGKLEWEGEIDHEEMEFEFFEKNTDHTKSLAALCHRYRTFFSENFRCFAGYFRGSRSGEGESTVCPESERICEGTNLGPEWGDAGQFEGTSGEANL